MRPSHCCGACVSPLCKASGSGIDFLPTSPLIISNIFISFYSSSLCALGRLSPAFGFAAVCTHFESTAVKWSLSIAMSLPFVWNVGSSSQFSSKVDFPHVAHS